MPKSACTTLKNFLYFVDHGVFFKDPLEIHNSQGDVLLTQYHHKIELSQKIKKCLVFTFVREPLRRSYSCFNEKIFYKGKYSFTNVRDYIATTYDANFDEPPDINLHRHNFKMFLKFVQDSISGANGWRRDAHWMPQAFVLRRCEQYRHADFIGRVERFDRDFRLLAKATGIDEHIVLPALNEGPAPPFPYSQILDDEICGMGRVIFADDYRLFGYPEPTTREREA